MGEIVAIYIPDRRYEQIPVFKLNDEQSKFIHEDFEYSAEVILIDFDWEVYSVDGDDFAKFNKYELNQLLGSIVDDDEIDSE
jgi:hypothetical protein